MLRRRREQRDDFSAAVRRELELRAGTVCAAPFCRQATTGGAADGGVARVGVAAHIAGASPNGPRYDVTQSSEARRAPANGLWLCQDHARLIDIDPIRFPPHLLREWKRIAEERPLASARGDVLSVHELPTTLEAVEIQDRSATSQIIRRWSHDLGIAEAWGARHAQAVEGLFGELVYNAFDHGPDSSTGPGRAVTLSSLRRTVSLAVPGPRFGPTQWDGQPNKGGGHAMLQRCRTLGPVLLLSHVYAQASSNRWTLSLHEAPDDGCGVRLDWDPSPAQLDRLARCSSVRLTVGWGMVSLSDPYSVLRALGRIGVRHAVVMDVSSEHLLADDIRSFAREVGIELEFLGMPPEAPPSDV